MPTAPAAEPGSASPGNSAGAAGAQACAEVAALEAAALAAAAAAEQAQQRLAAARARKPPPPAPAAAAPAARARAVTDADAGTDEDEAEGSGSADDKADDKAGEYEVEAVVATTRKCDDEAAAGTREKAHVKPNCKCPRTYLVKWKGYDASHNTWEPEEELQNVKDMLTACNAAHCTPPGSSITRTSSDSSASQTAAAAAAVTADATAAPQPVTRTANADAPAPAPPAPNPPKRTNSNTPYTNGRVTVVDPPSDGACGSHALCIGEGAAATAVAKVLELNGRIAAAMERDPDVFAATVADEDHTDHTSAIARRATALRAATARYLMRSADFDAYAMTHHRVAVVSASASGTTTQQFGRNTAPTTIVLIHVKVHYRVLIHVDGTRTFRADTIADALEFARAHATAWYTTGAGAPPFPDTSAADRKAADAAATAAAHAKPPAPDGPWRKQKGKLQYGDSLDVKRVIVITTNPQVTHIDAIEQRLAPSDVTLSQYARRWTVAPGGALHVEATTLAARAMLLEVATKVRRDTCKRGLIDMTPLIPAQQPGAIKAQAHAQPKPAAKAKKAKAKAKATAKAVPTPQAGDAAARIQTDATNSAVLTVLLDLTRQLARRERRARSRTRSPPPRIAPPFCAYCAKRAHSGACGQHANPHADSEDDDPASPARPRSRQRSRGHESDSDGQGDGSGSRTDRNKHPHRK
jgi:hypothetical protein